MMVRLFFYNKVGQQVMMEFGQPVDGVSIRLYGHDNVTVFNGQYFADIMTALVIGKDHVDGMVRYCNCKECRTESGNILAAAIKKSQEENK